jgi:hypothetical protein
VVLVTGSVAAAVAVAATSPPASGTWQIVPNHSQPGPSIDDFRGTFKVNGGVVSSLRGVTQHAVNRGCDRGVTVTMTGSAPISHALVPAVGADYYLVGGVNSFAHVHLTFHGRGTKKHPAKVRKGTGELRISFPGGSDTLGGYTSYSNITYESSTAGTCNLEFSILGG